MRPEHPLAFNVGALLKGGAALTTREVVAIVHEVRAHPGPAFPSGPEGLWLTGSGELVVEPSVPSLSPVDARRAMADLLEKLLPAAGCDGKGADPNAVSGLPAILRSASDDSPQDLPDLRSSLARLVGGNPRQVIRELTRRIFPRNSGAITPAGLVAPGLAPEGDPLPLLGQPPDPGAALADELAVMQLQPASAVDDDLDLYEERLSARPTPTPIRRAESRGTPAAGRDGVGSRGRSADRCSRVCVVLAGPRRCGRDWQELPARRRIGTRRCRTRTTDAGRLRCSRSSGRPKSARVCSGDCHATRVATALRGR